MKLNLLARMDVAYRNYGCVILIMIVVMILMNQHTCVVSVIVQQVGNGVQVNQIIDAYQNGYSVMAKMIVVITVMKNQKIAPYVILTQISNVQTIVAYQSNFYFIF